MERPSDDTHDFKIKVCGHITGRLTRIFEGLELTPTPDGHTVISATDSDQATLFGLLIRIRNCGIPLVSVTSQDIESGINDDPNNKEQKDV